MRTEKQHQASRINGSKSAGPRTPEGKAISSRNATKYGICVSDVAFYEDPEAANQLNQLRTEFFNFYQPSTPLERGCIEEVILCTVRLARLQRIEEGLYAEGREQAFVNESIPGPDGHPDYRFDQAQYPPEERRVVANMHVAASWRTSQDVFDSLTCQENRLSNRLRRAERRFDEMFPDRKQRPSAPQPEPAPQPTQTAPQPDQAPASPPKNVERSNEPEPNPTPVLPTLATDPSPSPDLPRHTPGKEAA